MYSLNVSGEIWKGNETDLLKWLDHLCVCCGILTSNTLHSQREMVVKWMQQFSLSVQHTNRVLCWQCELWTRSRHTSCGIWWCQVKSLSVEWKRNSAELEFRLSKLLDSYFWVSNLTVETWNMRPSKSCLLGQLQRNALIFKHKTKEYECVLLWALWSDT